MEDRTPTPGQEGRVLITPENGSAPFYATVEMADNPTQEGTPLNKASLLSDQAAEAVGLSEETAVPSNAFLALAGKGLQNLVCLLFEESQNWTVPDNIVLGFAHVLVCGGGGGGGAGYCAKRAY